MPKNIHQMARFYIRTKYILHNYHPRVTKRNIQGYWTTHRQTNSWTGDSRIS